MNDFQGYGIAGSSANEFLEVVGGFDTNSVNSHQFIADLRAFTEG